MKAKPALASILRNLILGPMIIPVLVVVLAGMAFVWLLTAPLRWSQSGSSRCQPPPGREYSWAVRPPPAAAARPPEADPELEIP